MKLYVIEGRNPITSEVVREIETSMGRVEKRIVEILQIDAFNPERRVMVSPTLYRIDIPTPVNRASVIALMKGDIYQFVVDENGDPDPRPNPNDPAMVRAVSGPAPNDAAPEPEPEADLQTDLEEEIAQTGQAEVEERLAKNEAEVLQQPVEAVEEEDPFGTITTPAPSA